MIRSKNMLKELLKNKEFIKVYPKYLKNKKVFDIIIFGSAVRGKENPSDIDILIVFSSKEDIDLVYGIRKELEKTCFNFQVIGKSYADVLSPNFTAREGILSEGYSLKNNNFISNLFGYSGFVLFKYSLHGLSNSEKMRFYYSLYGRGKGKGVLEHFEAIKFSDSSILSFIQNAEEIRLFLESKKILFKEVPVLIPSRLSTKKFLEAI